MTNCLFLFIILRTNAIRTIACKSPPRPAKRLPQKF